MLCLFENLTMTLKMNYNQDILQDILTHITRIAELDEQWSITSLIDNSNP